MFLLQCNHFGSNNIYVMVSNRSEDESENEGSIDGVVYGSTNNYTEATSDDYISVDMINSLCEEFSDEIYAINAEYDIGTGEITYGSTTESGTLAGVSAGYFVTNELTMLSGNMFSEIDFSEGKNVILVSDSFVDDVFDTDYKSVVGKEVEIVCGNNVGTFSIVGVYENESMNAMMGMFSAGTIYMPLKASVKFDNSDETFSYIQIIANTDVDTDTLSAKIQTFFEPYYKDNKNFEITTMTLSSMVSMLTSVMSTLTTAIAVIAGIALLVGGIGVMNIMLVSVTERTREIGTRKALGATNSSIRMQFIVEAMIICLIGGIIGVIVGIGGGILLANVVGSPATPSVSSIIISLLFSMTIGIFFGYYPANKAAKMNPIDALRYE